MEWADGRHLVIDAHRAGGQVSLLKKTSSQTLCSDVRPCRAHSLNQCLSWKSRRSALGCPQGNGNGFLQSWGLTEEKQEPVGTEDPAPGLAVLRVPSQASEVFELLPHLQNEDGDSRSACSPGFWAARMGASCYTLCIAQNKAGWGVVKVCGSPVDSGKLKPRGKRRLPGWLGSHRGASPQFPSKRLGRHCRTPPGTLCCSESQPHRQRRPIHRGAAQGPRPGVSIDRLAPARPPRGAVLPGQAGSGSCPPGSPGLGCPALHGDACKTLALTSRCWSPRVKTGKACPWMRNKERKEESWAACFLEATAPSRLHLEQNR